MVTVVEGLGLLDDARESRSEMRTTGLAGLDAATGGFSLGQCWVVLGTPGQGRSALAAQWAWLLAGEHQLTTQLVSKKDPDTRVAARIASAVAKVALNHLWSRGLNDLDGEKLGLVGLKLEAPSLSVTGPDEVSIADADVPGLGAPQVLVVDDAHLAGGMFPRRIASLAAGGVLVVVTMPRHRVVSDAGLDPSWAEIADFILDIDRPDLVDRSSFRPGEADLHLVRNRWGPTQSYALGFEGHFARFTDIR